MRHSGSRDVDGTSLTGRLYRHRQTSGPLNPSVLLLHLRYHRKTRPTRHYLMDGQKQCRGLMGSISTFTKHPERLNGKLLPQRTLPPRILPQEIMRTRRRVILHPSRNHPRLSLRPQLEEVLQQVRVSRERLARSRPLRRMER